MSLIADALKRAQKLKIQKAHQKPIPEGIILPPGKDRAKGSGSLGNVFRKRIIVFSTAFGIFIFFFLFFTLSVQHKIKKAPVIEPIKIEPRINSRPKVAARPSVAEEKSPDQGVSPPAEAEEAKPSENSPVYTSPDLPDQENQEPITTIEKKKEKIDQPPPASFLKEEKGKEGVINEPIVPSVQTPNMMAKATLPRVEEGKKPEFKKSNIDVQEVMRHFNQGVSSYQQKNLSTAIKEYNTVIQLDPRNLEALNNLGVIYKDLGKYREAKEYFQKALSINPHSPKVHNNLGLIYYLQGNHGKALAEYKKALASDPDNLESYTNLGVLYKKVGDLSRSLENFRKALAINALHPETNYNLGLIYEARGEIEKSIYHYKKFIRYSSKDYASLRQKVKRHLVILSRRTDPLSLGP